jgi:hypothetical protein
VEREVFWLKQMKKVALSIVVLTILLMSRFAFAQSFKPGSEPEGFRGVRWGTDISTLSGMEHYRTSEIGGTLPVDLWDLDRGALIEKIDLETYLKTGDELRMGGAELEKIEYGFWRGKFCEVTVTARGPENWVSLREAVFEEFGKGKLSRFSPPLGSIEEFDWYFRVGKTAEMELIYRSSSRIGKFWMGSALLREQLFEELRERAKKGAHKLN